MQLVDLALEHYSREEVKEIVRAFSRGRICQISWGVKGNLKSRRAFWIDESMNITIEDYDSLFLNFPYAKEYWVSRERYRIPSRGERVEKIDLFMEISLSGDLPISSGIKFLSAVLLSVYSEMKKYSGMKWPFFPYFNGLDGFVLYFPQESLGEIVGEKLERFKFKLEEILRRSSEEVLREKEEFLRMGISREDLSNLRISQVDMAIGPCSIRVESFERYGYYLFAVPVIPGKFDPKRDARVDLHPEFPEIPQIGDISKFIIEEEEETPEYSAKIDEKFFPKCLERGIKSKNRENLFWIINSLKNLGWSLEEIVDLLSRENWEIDTSEIREIYEEAGEEELSCYWVKRNLEVCLNPRVCEDAYPDETPERVAFNRSRR